MEMRTLRSDILTWKPEVDNRVHKLEHAVMDLGERIDHTLGCLLPHAQLIEASMDEQLGAVTIAPPPLTTAIREDHFAFSKCQGAELRRSGASSAMGGIWVFRPR